MFFFYPSPVESSFPLVYNSVAFISVSGKTEKRHAVAILSYKRTRRVLGSPCRARSSFWCWYVPDALLMSAFALLDISGLYLGLIWGCRQWTYSPGCPSMLSLRVSFPWSEDWQTLVLTTERHSRNRKDAFYVEIPAQKHLRFKEAGAQPF